MTKQKEGEKAKKKKKKGKRNLKKEGKKERHFVLSFSKDTRQIVCIDFKICLRFRYLELESCFYLIYLHFSCF